MTEMREGRAVTFGPDDIPEGADAARRVLARDNARLFAVVPLVFAGEVIGSIGFQRIRSFDLSPKSRVFGFVWWAI